MIDQQTFDNMPEGERISFFLVNSLRMLTDEQRQILCRSLLERLPEELYDLCIQRSRLGRGVSIEPTFTITDIKRLIQSMGSEEFNELKMREGFGREAGKAIENYVNLLLSKK